HEDGVLRDGAAHRDGVSLVALGIDRHSHWLDVQIVACLLERSVGGDRQDDLRAKYVRPQRPSAISRTLDREDNALGTTAGEVSAHLRVTAKVCCGHGDELVLKP